MRSRIQSADDFPSILGGGRRVYRISTPPQQVRLRLHLSSSVSRYASCRVRQLMSAAHIVDGI